MNSQKRTSIPQAAEKTIEWYKNLRVGDASSDKRIRCPYYRNPRSGRERWGLNAYSGKGTPEEIEQELKIIEKLEGKDFSELEEEQIRDIMRKRKLGIECSGFLSHVLDTWLQSEKGTRLPKILVFPAKTLFGKIAAFFRPFTHIDIATLTRPENASRLSDWKELQAGDIIRFHTKIDPDVVIAEDEIDHAVLVRKVEYDTGTLLPKRIFYVQSVRERHGEGMKKGVITIIDPQKPIEEQQWQEFPDTGTTVNERATTQPECYHFLFLD